MKIVYHLLFALIISTFGCKEDNPTQTNPTIEDRINVAKPIKNIFINHGSGSSESFYANGGNLKDAYAENGYFIVKDISTHYYNLGLTKEVEVNGYTVTLRF